MDNKNKSRFPTTSRDMDEDDERYGANYVLYIMQSLLREIY